MSRRAHIELTERGHDITVYLATSDEVMVQAVEKHHPDLIIAPMLKKAIPEVIWKKYTCLIVHPGIKGDRGPSSIDWAIHDKKEEWGVTILQADAEMDAGDIWATENFKMSKLATKSHLYRHETTEAVMRALILAVERFEQGDYTPEPLDYNKPDVKGHLHVPMKQTYRGIDWTTKTEDIARKIRCSDSQPGVLDDIEGEAYYLFGAHEEDQLKGQPGEIIAKRHGAICRATGDGAIWITHLKRKKVGDQVFFKVPATLALGEKLSDVPEVPVGLEEEYEGRTFRDIWYTQKGEVGYLHFNFYNGAMSTEQCRRLREAYQQALKKDTKVIVLMGGPDIWSNGIHLNVIEAADHPADESWANINAMDDLVRDIIQTKSHLVISAMQGNAGAGGVILALAADFVFAREGVVLNPHYKGMGGLYGSEYWTYLLPKRVGPELAYELTENCISLGTKKAKEIDLIDDAFGKDTEAFCETVSILAERLVYSVDYELILEHKVRVRMTDEQMKPLEQYRKEELEEMWENFYSPDSKYHEARKNFVYKKSPTCTEVEVNLLSDAEKKLQLS